MEEKLSLWAEDFTTELDNDIKSLGIEAEIHAPHGILVKFKSNEDLNLYRLSGKHQEDYYLLFLGPNDKVEHINLNTVLHPSILYHGHKI